MLPMPHAAKAINMALAWHFASSLLHHDSILFLPDDDDDDTARAEGFL